MKRFIALGIVTFLSVGCGGGDDNSPKPVIFANSLEFIVVEGMKKDIQLSSDKDNVKYEILSNTQNSDIELFKNSGLLIYRASDNEINPIAKNVTIVATDANGKQSNQLTLTFKTVSKDIQPSIEILKTGADDGGFGKDRRFTISNGDIIDPFGNVWAEDSDPKLTEAKTYLNASNKCELIKLYNPGSNWRLPTMDEALNLIDYSKLPGTSMLESIFTNQTLAYTWVEAKNDNKMAVSFNNALVANIDQYNIGQAYTSRCINAPSSNNNNIISTDRYSGVTYDFSTGLKWSPITQSRRFVDDVNESATQYCTNYQSENGWRVPNINELRSIIEGSSVSSFITNGATILISSTPYRGAATESNYAMYLRENGTIGFGIESVNTLLGITCVSSID